MNAFLIALSLVVSLGVVIASPSEGPIALLLCVGVAAVPFALLLKSDNDRNFLLRLFISALIVRIAIGTVIYSFKLQDFFGGDALTYDFFGFAQLQAWYGDDYYRSLAGLFVGQGEGAGWGMLYFVAVIYGVVGRNLLAIQFVNSVMGAATPVLIYFCAQQVYNNTRVARIAAVSSAFYPSLVLWSAQGLKDGPIVFALSLAILATLKLGERFKLVYLVALIASLFSLLTLRFYVFYMLVVAVAGAFVVGIKETDANSLLRRVIVIIALGLSLTYLGVTRYANLTFTRFGSLEQVNRSRLDASTNADSGFAKDVDVSTTQGALATIPIGLTYLLFAPFPWQLATLRQSITLPEMLIWWFSFPMLVMGLWFSLKYRLRRIFPIFLFTVMLSLAYSIFQGNVGTAYRQRAQLLVFYFIFTAVGYVLVLEKRAEKKRRAESPDFVRGRDQPSPTGD